MHPTEKPGDENVANENGKPGKFTRRDFLKSAGATIAGLIGVSTAGGCEVVSPLETTRPVPYTTDRVPISVQYPAVPYTPAAIPPPGPLKFFTPQEARAVDAFTARLLPGTPEDPGAREAGVVYYIDHLMAYPEGFAESIYRKPPFVQAYEGDTPPLQEGQPGAEGVIWVPASEIERYGYQAIYTPREVMRMGLAALDRFANDQFGGNFADLSEEQQDQLIERMVEGDAEGFEPLTPKSFFQAMRRYTSEGIFCDPVYGGNRDMVGWRLIGFPGAQRAYTPDEIQAEGLGLRLEPISMAQLPPFNPGVPVGPNTINPVSGTTEHQHPSHDTQPLSPFQQEVQQQFHQQQQPPGPEQPLQDQPLDASPPPGQP